MKRRGAGIFCAEGLSVCEVAIYRRPAGLAVPPCRRFFLRVRAVAPNAARSEGARVSRRAAS